MRNERAQRRRVGVTRAWVAACLLAACVVAACGMPRDPEGTSARVRGGTLRVGVVTDGPWARYENGRASGVEVDLVERLARELGARVAWVPGGEGRLLDELEHFRLDLVVGGLTAETPWSDRVGLSLYHARARERGEAREHAFATPPGENGWLLTVDRFLYRHRAGRAP